MQYKINVVIKVDYISVDNLTGITDLYLTPTNPSGVGQTPILFTAVGNGLYTANFTPNALGWWTVRVTSSTYPDNISAKSYYVGTSDDPYPAQEDGKITSVDTKIGEVQTTPTVNTLLGRLKEINDNTKILNGEIQTYVAYVFGSIVGSSKVHGNLWNASGSGKKIKIYDVRISVSNTGGIVGQNIPFTIRRTTARGTVTTSVTIEKIDTQNTSLPAQITMDSVFSVNPTLSSYLGETDIDTEESRTGQANSIYKSSNGLQPITLNEGEGLSVVQGTYASNGLISIWIYFTII